MRDLLDGIERPEHRETRRFDSGREPSRPSAAEPEFDVFLSHNSKDKPAVRELSARLTERGLRTWLDEEQLRPGLKWQTALEQIVRTCRSAVVCVGPDGQGPWHQNETEALLNRFAAEDPPAPVIPVLLPEAPDDVELPLFLENHTWVDCRGGLTDDLLDRLKWGITGEKPR